MLVSYILLQTYILWIQIFFASHLARQPDVYFPHLPVCVQGRPLLQLKATSHLMGKKAEWEDTMMTLPSLLASCGMGMKV